MDESWPHGVEATVDIALLGRYYERIADHAVSMTRRVIHLVTGELHVAVSGTGYDGFDRGRRLWVSTRRPTRPVSNRPQVVALVIQSTTALLQSQQ